jgi:hypothetical protein
MSMKTYKLYGYMMHHKWSNALATYQTDIRQPMNDIDFNSFNMFAVINGKIG